MPDISQGPLSAGQGQSAVTPASADGVTSQNPQVAEGQASGQVADGQGQAQAQASSTPSAESSFFDANNLPPELVPVYKQMQSAFTKKMQGLSGHKQKIEAYDAFMTDPVTNLQKMAQQYGYHLSRADAQAMANGQQPGQQSQDWQPKTWDDVIGKVSNVIMQNLSQQLQPLVQNVQTLHTKTFEQQLSEIDPNWKIYEDDIAENLRMAPGLINKPDKLYQMSVPAEVLAGRATQQAVKKLTGTVNASKVEGKGQTSRSEAAPKKVSTFDDAVAEARRMLQQSGR